MASDDPVFPLPDPWEHVPLSDSGDGADEATRVEVMAEADERCAAVAPLRTSVWAHALCAGLDALVADLHELAATRAPMPTRMRTPPVVWAWSGDEEEQIPGGEAQVRLALRQLPWPSEGGGRRPYYVAVLEDYEVIDQWHEGELPDEAPMVRDRLVLLWVLVRASAD